MKHFLFSLCLLFLFAIVVFAQGETKSFTKVGDAMPDFSVTEIGGKEFKISALKGKIVYVNFWATWCPPCAQEMPRIEQEIWQPNKESENFAVVLIAREQTEKDIIPFIEKYNYTFPVAADPKRAIFDLFGNVGIPRNYIVGADGKILYQSVGYSTAEFDRIKALLADELVKSKSKR